MALDLLPDVEHLDHRRSYGGTYQDGVPFRFVAHSTEVTPSSVEGARALALRHEYPPHFWAWPEKDWIAQTVLMSRSAFALLHPAGTPETNRMRAIQVEIIGHAADMANKPDSFWEWIGERLVAPVVAAGYPINLDRVAPLTGSDGYGRNGTVRMARDEWRTFDGLCAHSNVPDNEHWDIGDGRLDLVAAAARIPAPNPQPAPSPEDPFMADITLTYDDIKKIAGAQFTRAGKAVDTKAIEGWYGPLIGLADDPKRALNGLCGDLGISQIP